MPDLDVTETYVEYALEADNMSFYIDHWNSENDRLTSYSVKEHSTMYVQHTLITNVTRFPEAVLGISNVHKFLVCIQPSLLDVKQANMLYVSRQHCGYISY